jgi:hypothetical protein
LNCCQGDQQQNSIEMVSESWSCSRCGALSREPTESAFSCCNIVILAKAWFAVAIMFKLMERSCRSQKCIARTREPAMKVAATTIEQSLWISNDWESNRSHTWITIKTFTIRRTTNSTPWRWKKTLTETASRTCHHF